MKIKKGKKEGQYEVESVSQKGKFYTVDLDKDSCSCPVWVFRRQRCKHIAAVQEKYGKPAPQKKASKSLDKPLDYIKAHQNINSVEFMEKFSEDILNGLIEAGEIIEEKGKLRLI